MLKKLRLKFIEINMSLVCLVLLIVFATLVYSTARQLEEADYAVANLETVLAGGPDYSGFPAFNSPDELAYDELMVTKLGISQLIKQFDIATGYAEPSPEPYQYQPKTDTPAE